MQDTTIDSPSPLTIKPLLLAALRYQDKNAEAEAEAQYRTFLPVAVRVLGPEDAETLRARGCHADVLLHLHKTDEAAREYQTLLKAQEHVHGPEHPDTLATCLQLALCLRQQDKNAEALPHACRALAGWLKALGKDHPDTRAAQKLVDELKGKTDKA